MSPYDWMANHAAELLVLQPGRHVAAPMVIGEHHEGVRAILIPSTAPHEGARAQE